MVNVRFKINLESPILAEPVENLELDNRGYHVVKRSGFNKIGDIVNEPEKIRAFKGCGDKTYNGVLKSVFEYYIKGMTDEELNAYTDHKVKVTPV